MSKAEPPRPKVLIVDDQPRNLDALEAMLSSSDCVLVRASSADETLLRVLEDDYAAIVLDIRMPDISGIELARLIKQRRRSEHVPILFLTAYMLDNDDILQGYGVGAVDYLSKPVNPQILRSKIGFFVDLFRKTHALTALNERLQEEVAERKSAQRALQAVNEELERRVEERTAALARAHQDVQENEERWRMAMDVAHVVAWEWHLGSDQMTWSTNPEALLGFPPGAFGEGLRITSRLHPGDRPLVEDRISASHATGSYEVEYRLVRPDGSVVWLTERGCVMPDSDGRPERLVGISRDVTAEHLAGEEREALLQTASDARDEAQRQGRLKDEFLATLSHELRTPMNVVLGWLDILSSGKLKRDLGSTLALIQRNAQLQAKLIDDLLDMNRLLSGRLHMEMAPVDVGATLRSTIRSLQPTADAKRVTLLARVQPSLAEVVADARRVQQVLWNLLHNAIKFTPDGGRVEARVEQVDRELQIAVQDTGAGISPAFLPHVFERFRQEDSSSTRESGGLGLGLSISKRLVEMHGGTITAQSDGQGCGATFIVRLPPPDARGVATTGGGNIVSADPDDSLSL